MSKRIFTMMAVMLLTVTMAMAQGKYSIKGNLNGADGETIYLRYGDRSNMKNDSTVVKKGKFQFKGKMDTPYQQAMLVLGNINDYRNRRYVQFALEPAKITVTGDADNMQEAVVNGSNTQEEENALNASYGDAMNKLKALNKAYNDPQKSLSEREALLDQMEPYQDEISSKQREFYRTHPDSYLSPKYLRQTMGHMTYDEIKPIYDSFSADVKQFGGEDVREIEKELRTLERVRPGAMAPDFAKTDVNGKMFRLSDLRGKVVILDFWASWCKPCRASNPHMRELYKKYHPLGLELVYSASDDGAEAKWRKAIEEDKLVGEGYHHILRGYDRNLQGQDNPNDNSLLYGIHYLPTKYLIDREGRIVGKVESDEWLDQQLERLLGKAEYPFTINGNVANAEGKQVMLVYGTMRNQKQETTTVKDGKFQFKGVMDNPYYGGRLVLGDWDPYMGGDYTEVAIEKGTITVDAPTGKLAEALVKGGKTQDEQNAYNAEMKPVMAELIDLNNKMGSNAFKNAKQRAAAENKMESLRKRYGEIQQSFIKNHPDSYLTPGMLAPSLGSMRYEDIKKTYEGFSENVKLYGDVEEIEKELEALSHTQPGAAAPDFTTKDINGKDFSFSSLKGKVVVLDFWASWCVPCRKSNPHMKALYEKYHDKGLEMVYVSDDDSNPNAWKNAVEKDGLTGEGFHHVLRGLKHLEGGRFDRSTDISDKYAIHFLPTKYLIDREGKIVCKIDEGQDEKLDRELEKLMK